jgi:hypothetical protein
MRCLDIFHLFLVVVSVHILLLNSFMSTDQKENWPELRERLDRETQAALQAHPFNAFLAELQRYQKDYRQLELTVISVRSDGSLLTDKFSSGVFLYGISLPDEPVFRKRALSWLNAALTGKKIIFQHFVPSGMEKPAGLFFRREEVSVAEELLEMGLGVVAADASLSPPLKARLDLFALRGKANFQGMWGKEK